ncbi:MAG TPA: hypothetical protein VER58_15845 [Thermoanaerobaculia bacterium]|nr:hypothetical protein [Thermoanaerobaculia bacterium]
MSRIYATIFTATAILLTAWAILANDRGEDPPIAVTETITVTALAPDANIDPHAKLRRYLQSYNPYNVPRECLEIRNVESDVFDVVNQCKPDREVLGSFRVDKLTGVIVRRR